MKLFWTIVAAMLTAKVIAFVAALIVTIVAAVIDHVKNNK
jgi:hypothetical protein